MRIGVIGCGTIASAAIHGIAQDGHQITVSERSSRNASMLADTYDNVRIADNQGVVDASDVIFLGLMAEVAQEILGALKFRDDQRLITFMAAATLEEADAMVRPARVVAIMMPFPGISKGGTPIMMQGDAALVHEIFGNRNSIFPLKDAHEIAAYLCAQAVLSPVAKMVNDAAEWLGERVSDKAKGEAFLRALVASNLSDTASADLIEALNTPGGYNQRLRIHMEASGMGDALVRGLNELE
ncbi:pyrroline-5-carboxylate reductase [Sulfitobacter sp. SK012]|uniref:NAD(P)-binding domain-containing protein n=1 Tax=Sulfitobacter sp. SK012 TaxID=1389005 RepID=UPI000E0AA4BA|nr:NAD(P)-binding domain-containing protein [Sulfitobacter sp. SK012]AXI46649.1 pyrroline-5-carboxylate reductase [Sulfitobacter sp. SK012]